MSDSPPAAASPPPIADPQDPLPESNWFWRRLFVGLMCAALIGIVWWYTGTVGKVALNGSVDAIKGLVELLRVELRLLAMVILFYMIAPSAEQVVKMLATISAWKNGISTTSSAKSTAADGSKAEAHTAAGPAVSAPATPAAPAALAATEELPEYAR